MKRLRYLTVLLVVAAAGGGLWWQFGKGKDEAAKPAGPPVVPIFAVQAERQVVPLRVRSVGTVKASAVVAVKSRVDGEIVQVAFTEGQDVKAGDLLFTLDARTLQAQLRQAEANLARNRAQLSTARHDVERYAELAKKDHVSRQQFEKAQATLGTLEASIRADDAAVEVTRVQLGYTAIRSPIDGRVGALLVDKGNLVKANDTGALVVIHRLQPVDVSFSVPERHLADVRARMAGSRGATVTVTTADAEDRAVPGEVTFVDNTVDVNTATIGLKATFANEDRILWPGQFVRVALQLGGDEPVLAVPAEAVQESQKGTVAYLVKADQTVEVRPVKVLRVNDGKAVIGAGLEAGDTVVTEGHIRLAPGTKVAIREKGKPAGAAPGNGKPG
ncbi:MAG: efflux RND transporter periplasmic adaptor subunit [Magnetospirillum sp. WYHS-4]